MWWIGMAIGIAIGILFCPQIGIFGPYWTIVKEGTAKVVLRFGGYKKVLFCWKDHDVDEDGNVIDAPGEKSRGLQFVGWRHIDTLLQYKFRWKDIQLVEGEEREQFHEVERDWILVREDVYIITLKAAETKPPERIPIDIRFAYTFRVVNVRKATLVAPPNWFENATVRLNSAHRKFVASHTLDELLTMMKEKTEIRAEEIDKSLLDYIKDVWGIETKAVQIRDIALPPAYQKAAAMKREMEFKADARAVETIGTVIRMMAEARGKSLKEIQDEIERNEEMKKEFLNTAKDLLIRKLGMESRSYIDIRVVGAQGLERMILNALAAWKRMPESNLEGTKQKREEFQSEEKIEELQKKYQELYFKWQAEKDPKKKRELWEEMRKIIDKMAKAK